MTYKFANREHTKVDRLDNGTYGIHPDSYLWPEYQAWLAAGGATLPWKTEQEIKDEMWEMIKEERTARKSGGIKVGTLWYHSDPDSRVQHLGLKDEARDILDAGGNMSTQLVLDGRSVPWKTMGGTWSSPLTVQAVLDIVAAGKVLDSRLHVAAEIHKMQMEASPDPAAYDYTSAGWPERYQDAI
jgi:hypothetical protein